MSHSFQIDPHDILGVSSDASLQDIRDAYKQKSKRYHPDLGGESWAFRMVYQAYEILSTRRVTARAEAEPLRPRNRAYAYSQAQAQAAASASYSSGSPKFDPSSTARATPGESVRNGLSDRVDDPTKVVDVEILWIRFEADHAWIFQPGKSEDRSLSCSLNIAWPDAGLADLPGDHAETIAAVSAAFAQTMRMSKPVSSRTQQKDDHFAGWLSFATADLAWAAFRNFREALHARKLAVKQWSRDIQIPRDWR